MVLGQTSHLAAGLVGLMCCGALESVGRLGVAVGMVFGVCWESESLYSIYVHCPT